MMPFHGLHGSKTLRLTRHHPNAIQSLLDRPEQIHRLCPALYTAARRRGPLLSKSHNRSYKMTSQETPLTDRCQCNSVNFPTPAARHIDLFHCHCTECQKQSATAFGTSALYPAEGLFPLSDALKSKLSVYTRSTDNGGTMDCYFCPTCGSRLFHRIIGKDGTPRPTVSIKGGCIEGLDWSGGKHIYARSAVMNIPKDWEQYETVPDSLKRERDADGK
jgi:hypothetical protein